MQLKKVSATAVWCVVVVLAFCLETPAASGMQVIVPAYWYPGTIPDPNFVLMANGAPTCAMAVVNNNNGPGPFYEVQYGANINLTVNAGMRILGYISSNAAAVPLSSIYSQVDLWASYYGLDIMGGIFIDVGTYDCVNASYYTDIKNYVHSKSPNWIMILNEGFSFPECFVNSSDIFISFEGTLEKYLTSYKLQGWEHNYPPSIFWQIIHNTPNVSAMEMAVQLARSNYAGYVFVTDLTYPPDPYKGIPSYWTTELAYLQSLTSSSSTSPTVTGGSGSGASSSGSSLRSPIALLGLCCRWWCSVTLSSYCDEV